MKSILNIEVSCFKDYNTPGNPANVNLLRWLTSNKYKDRVEAIRSLDDKSRRDEIKATLPAVTPSGIFSYRSQNKILSHSGFIQIDIDGINREEVEPYKRELSKVSNIAYLGLSVSGKGLWGLIPIPADKDSHKAYFDAINTVFDKWGITLDDKPKNVASLRGYSYDPEAYFNHEAKLFNVKKEVLAMPPPLPPQQRISKSDYQWLLDWITEQMTKAMDGDRHATRLKIARLTGGYIAGGVLDYSAENLLIDTYLGQYGSTDSQQVKNKEIKAIRDGVIDGMKNPLSPPEQNKVFKKGIKGNNFTPSYPIVSPGNNLPAETIFIHFDCYTRGLHMKDNILICENEYPASWDDIVEVDYIEAITKEFIRMAEKNPVLLELKKAFKLSTQ
ncbi:MAG: BT4734/BF3469 family protein [Fulvivirga sp.]